MDGLEPVRPEDAVKFLFPSGGIHGRSVQDAESAFPRYAITNRQVVLLAFGLPLMTACITLGSIYLGFIVSTRSDRPVNLNVAQPHIDVNVPQAAPPTVEVNPQSPQVHVQLPPTAPPNITVTPPAATVTLIDRRPQPEISPAPPVETAAAANPAAATEARGAFKPAVEPTTPAALNVSARGESAAVVPLQAAPPDPYGALLPRTDAEIARQKAEEEKHKKAAP